MAIEKSWEAIPSRVFTSDGGTAPANAGLVTLATTIDFRVKQQVVVTANALLSLELEVKQVISDTQMYVGSPGNIANRQDLTGYTVAANAAIFAVQQPRPSIPEKEYSRAEFEEEPVVAKRSFLVDDYGNPYNSENPFPVTQDSDGILLFNLPYDSGQTTYPSSTQTVYTTYKGGFSGTPVQQVTLNFTDATQNNLLNWQRANWNGSAWIVSL
jgi:hypothetical protein